MKMDEWRILVRWCILLVLDFHALSAVKRRFETLKAKVDSSKLLSAIPSAAILECKSLKAIAPMLF